MGAHQRGVLAEVLLAERGRAGTAVVSSRTGSVTDKDNTEGRLAFQSPHQVGQGFVILLPGKNVFYSVGIRNHSEFCSHPKI